MAVRLRWLGPAIVVTGLGVGGLGVWWMKRARPVATAFVDVVAVEGGYAVAVRRDRDSDRSHVEAHAVADGVRWRALVPSYAGTRTTPGLAASPEAVTVRASRDGRAELWALSAKTAGKLGRVTLSGEGPPRADSYRVPVAVTVRDPQQPSSAVRTVEVIGDDAGLTLIMIDVNRGAQVWTRTVPHGLTGLALDGDALWLARGVLRERWRLADGTPWPTEALPAPVVEARLADVPGTPVRLWANPPVWFEASTRSLYVEGGATLRLPDGVLDVQAQQASASHVWLLSPDRLDALALPRLTHVYSSCGPKALQQPLTARCVD